MFKIRQTYFWPNKTICMVNKTRKKIYLVENSPTPMDRPHENNVDVVEIEDEDT